MTSSAMVVLSGGQDSTTALFWAKKYCQHIHAISFDYGQRHRLELEAAEKVARMACTESYEVVDIRGTLESVSPLLSNNDLEKYDNFEQMDKVIGNRVELTFVPMRNTLFLTIAANRAVTKGCHSIITGICQEDNANYPDCRETFRITLQQAFRLSLGDDTFIQIVAPLMHKSKAETVKMAYNLPGCWEALAHTHTSYDGKYPPIDNNHSNVLRAHGFEEAGLPDPLVVRAWKEGLMELPDTPNYDVLRRGAD